jgi:hypothetical protein
LEISLSEKEKLQQNFIEIHQKLGDAALPYEIRSKFEKSKDDIIKDYFKKFGKHISSEL